MTLLWNIHHCCAVKPMGSGVWLSCKSPTCTNLHSVRLVCHQGTLMSLEGVRVWYPYGQSSPSEQPPGCGFIRWLLSSKASTTWSWPTGVVRLGARGTSGRYFFWLVKKGVESAKMESIKITWQPLSPTLLT